MFHQVPQEVFFWAVFEMGYWGSASLTSQTLIPLMVKGSLGELATSAPVLWGVVIACATLLGVLSCPLVGSIADHMETRKFFVFIFTSIAIGMSFLFLLFRDNWMLASIFAGFTILPTVITMTLFNSLLVFLTQREEELARASTTATFLGCLGPAILLTSLQFPSLDEYSLSPYLLWVIFITAAVWWLSFSVPLYVMVPEFKSELTHTTTVESKWMEAKELIAETIGNTNLVKLLVALFIFGDTSAAMFHLSFIFGAAVGIDTQSLFGGMVVNRWLSVLMCFVWAALVDRISAKLGFIVVMIAMLFATIVAFFMTTASEFWLLQVLLSIVSTGAFIFGRVLLASVTPVEKAGFHFGFLGAVGNLSGFFGPMMYAMVGAVSGDAKDGFLFLSMLTGIAILLLSSVDFSLARMAAQADPKD